MRRFFDCSMIALVLFAYWLFVFNPMYQRYINWRALQSIRAYSDEAGQRAKQAIVERGRPELLPWDGINWQLQGLEEEVAEQNRYDINFVLDQ